MSLNEETSLFLYPVFTMAFYRGFKLDISRKVLDVL